MPVEDTEIARPTVRESTDPFRIEVEQVEVIVGLQQKPLFVRRPNRLRCRVAHQVAN